MQPIKPYYGTVALAYDTSYSITTAVMHSKACGYDDYMMDVTTT